MLNTLLYLATLNTDCLGILTFLEMSLNFSFSPVGAFAIIFKCNLAKVQSISVTNLLLLMEMSTCMRCGKKFRLQTRVCWGFRPSLWFCKHMWSEYWEVKKNEEQDMTKNEVRLVSSSRVEKHNLRTLPRILCRSKVTTRVSDIWFVKFFS